MRTPCLPLLAAAALACGDTDDRPPLVAPLGPVPLIDGDSDPDHIEVRIVAGAAEHAFLPDKPADVWAYRDANDLEDFGRVPGPMLLGRVGDRVTVHFRNELPVDTTIHWHGLKVPAQHDGSHVSPAPVGPGHEHTYEFTLTEAGTFWFHPHLDADVQVERGLYAPIVVRGDDDVPVDNDRVLVLDDVKLESDGRLSENITSLDLMVGRIGNVLLVNGEQAPRLTAPAGARERWRLINAANGTYFNLAVPDASIRVIGTDGGLVPAPYVVDELLVAPGERYELIVDLPGQPGEERTLETHHYDRGHDLPDLGPRPLATIVLGEPSTAELPPLPTRWGDVEALPVAADTPRRALVLTEEEPAGPDDEPRFFFNDQSWPDVEPVAVAADALEVWEIDNQAEMDHPFHLHGTFFQQLDGPYLVWKDTINIPRQTTVRIAVRYDNPGSWMYHCHILEHAERGMMGVLEVGAP